MGSQRGGEQPLDKEGLDLKVTVLSTVGRIPEVRCDMAVRRRPGICLGSRPEVPRKVSGQAEGYGTTKNKGTRTNKEANIVTARAVTRNE